LILAKFVELRYNFLKNFKERLYMLSICLALLQNPDDKSRFEEFYNKFHSVIYLIAKDHLKSKEAAEDCAQEILIRFAKDFHNINQDFDDKRFKAYVRVVSRGIAIDMYRKEKRHSDNVVDTEISEFIHLSVKEFDACDLMALKQAVDAMPDSYKDAFILKYYYQFTAPEIAAKTGMSEVSVRQKCFLGMKFVKDFLKDDKNDG
jgi:RNA polymerase sigma-70 factor (ECF subfamily)